MAGVLMMWGPLQFEIWPLNFHEVDHVTESDWARKEVLEASPQREFVGEGDETMDIRGRIFPLANHAELRQGFNHLEAFERMRREAQAHQLIRGGIQGGRVLGWWVCERLTRNHTDVGPGGVGRVVNFEARFARVDTPQPDNYFNQIFSITST